MDIRPLQIMKRTWDYNLLRNGRMKNLMLALIMLAGLFLFIYRFFENTKNHVETNFISMGVIYLVALLLFSFFPIRQVVEKINQSEFVTYYLIGWLTFNEKAYLMKGNDIVRIKQDEKKYYCLTISTKNAGDIIIERYPTLDSVKIRERQLNEILN